MKLAQFNSDSTVFEIFRAFHQDMLNAIETGNFLFYGFCKGVGLCYNFKIWREGKNLPHPERIYEEYQKNWFIGEFEGNYISPFNSNGGYCDEQLNNDCYSNPKRVEFIKKIAGMK